MRDIRPKNITKRVSQIISGSKYLRTPKYYKTNKTGLAAWDSWAARGQDGGCGACGVGHYNCTIYNKRKTTPSKHWHSNKIAPNLCSGCYRELLKQINYEFSSW